jgi:hypothetical protein
VTFLRRPELRPIVSFGARGDGVEDYLRSRLLVSKRLEGNRFNAHDELYLQEIWIVGRDQNQLKGGEKFQLRDE